MSKVYLSGPMSNRPFFNFYAFFEAQKKLESEGHEVFNPAEYDIKTYGDGFWRCPNGTQEEAMEQVGREISYRTLLRKDLAYIFDEAEVIALLPDWEKSKGARCEMALAECLGLEVIHL